mgnify:FL=1
MNNCQSDVIKLIKSALSGGAQELSPDINLDKISDIAKNHGICSVIYYGALICGISAENPAMEALFTHTCNYAARNVAQEYEISALLKEFDKNEIEYMPLKGCVIKALYPKPEMRVMSDADILIKPYQYDEIKSIMIGLGFNESGVSDHELKWNKTGLLVELHNKLIPSYNKDYFAYYGDGWQLAAQCDGTRYSMSDDDQMVYLFTHFAKHYRDAGIGLKHIIDLWVFKKSKPLNEKYIYAELKKLKLYDFYINIFETLEVWFENKQSTEMSDFITDYIFDCGAAGNKENYYISDILKNSEFSDVSHNGKLKMFIYYLFFPYEKMCMKYPVLIKHRCLLPLMWIVRALSALFNRKSYGDITGISQDKISNRQQGLNYVGLRFDFKEQ